MAIFLYREPLQSLYVLDTNPGHCWGPVLDFVGSSSETYSSGVARTTAVSGRNTKSVHVLDRGVKSEIAHILHTPQHGLRI